MSILMFGIYYLTERERERGRGAEGERGREYIECDIGLNKLNFSIEHQSQRGEVFDPVEKYRVVIAVEQPGTSDKQTPWVFVWKIIMDKINIVLYFY